MNCAIYLRTSTKEQNPELQEQECRRFAESRGYTVICVCSEQLSGYKDIRRPEYEQVKEMAHKGEIKAVVVWALDRWVRNRDTLLEDITVLRNCGCKLHSVKESYLEAINIDGALGRTIQDFLIGLMGSLAEMESSLKSERIKMAVRKKGEKTVSYKGNKWGRKALSTFKVNRIQALRLEGKSMREIAVELGCSVGSVHKTIAVLGIDKKQENGDLAIS